MQTKYYKITGMNEGSPITPYVVTADELDDALEVYGDKVRYHEPISKEEYDRHTSEELAMQTLQATQIRRKIATTPSAFTQVITKLVSMRFAFEVHNCQTVPEFDENAVPNLVYMIPSIKQYLGKDILLLIVQLNNTEHVLYEFDENGLFDVLNELNYW